MRHEGHNYSDIPDLGIFVFHWGSSSCSSFWWLHNTPPWLLFPFHFFHCGACYIFSTVYVRAVTQHLIVSATKHKLYFHGARLSQLLLSHARIQGEIKSLLLPLLSIAHIMAVGRRALLAGGRGVGNVSSLGSAPSVFVAQSNWLGSEGGVKCSGKRGETFPMVQGPGKESLTLWTTICCLCYWISADCEVTQYSWYQCLNMFHMRWYNHLRMSGLWNNRFKTIKPWTLFSWSLPFRALSSAVPMKSLPVSKLYSQSPCCQISSPEKL